MLRRVTLTSTLVVALFALVWLFQFAVPRPSDYTLVQELLNEEKNPSHERRNVAHQQRKGIRKEIWITSEDGNRLHDIIESNTSTLTLVPRKHKVDIVEHLGKTHVWMQDKLYTGENGSPMQQMRQFSADIGTYHFRTHAFTSNRSTLSFFRLPGHALTQNLDDEDAYLKGNAKDLSFSLDGKQMRFEADTFHARLRQ